jgi:2-polyprenyl-3-methyl-5-hydroxy-6-metoxy-1,4-benzoquinol methylase
MDSRSALEKAFATLSPYSKKYNAYFDRFHFSLNLIKKIPNFRGKKFLDIGTGIGLLPVAIRNMGAKIDGIEYYVFPDSQNEMFQVKQIDDLQKIWKEHNITVHNIDIFSPKVKETIEPVDVIISECMIEHLKDPKKFLTIIHSLLKENGILILVTPNIATLLKRLRFIFGKSPLWPVDEFIQDGENFTGHWREYTQDELAFICEQSGFIVEQKYNKNLITKFKGIKSWRKNIRAFVMMISSLLPKGREMHYLVCKKK